MDASDLQTFIITVLVGPAMVIAGLHKRIVPHAPVKWALAPFGSVATIIAMAMIAGLPGFLFALSSCVLLFSRDVVAPWVRPLRRTASGLALGLAPQTLFLTLYNGGAADWAPWLSTLIPWWENRALAINVALKNTDDIGLLWWSAIIVALLVGSWVFRGTRLVAHRSAVLSRAAVISNMSVLFAISSAMPATNWDPSASHRLEAVRHDAAQEEVRIAARVVLNEKLAAIVARQPDAIPAFAAGILAHLSRYETPDLDAARRDRLRDTALADWTQTELIDAVAKSAPEPAAPAKGRDAPRISEKAALAALPDAKAAAKLTKERAKETREATKSIVEKAVRSVASAVKDGAMASLPLSDVPLAKEALDKMLDRIADNVTERIVKGLPTDAVARSVEAMLGRLVASPHEPQAFERLATGYRKARAADDTLIREKEMKEEVREQQVRERAAIRR